MAAESVTVTVSDPPATVAYTLRSVRDEPSDIRRWAEFCAFCFSYKPPPPPAAYFERHFFNDPRRDAGGIKILEFEGEGGKTEIASTLRVFRRTVSDGAGGAMEAGGIGEVCTHPDHRKRGLSKILLTNAISFMEDLGLETSLLHASAALTPVYKKGGDYECTVSHWLVIEINPLKLLAVEEGCTVRLAAFPADTKRLQALHKSYSEERFAGCIVRTAEYWNEYVRKEIGASLFVLSKGESVVAWLSIRPRGDKFQLREFGLAKEELSAAKAMSMLLQIALEKESPVESINLLLPAVVLNEVKADERDCSTSCSFICWDIGAQKEDDIGWMYRPIKTDKMPGMVDLTKDGGRQHLIWPTDTF